MLPLIRIYLYKSIIWQDASCLLIRPFNRAKNVLHYRLICTLFTKANKTKASDDACRLAV